MRALHNAALGRLRCGPRPSDFLGRAALLAACLSGGVAHAQLDPSSLEPDLRLAPSEVLPNASATLLNDVARVGDGFIAVGKRGHILRSGDGQVWTQVTAPVRSMLTTIEFPTPKVGYIGGHDGVILKTTDGGNAWSLMRFDPADSRPPIIYDLHFDTPESGWALGTYGLLLRTDDGGKTWDTLEPDFAWIGHHNSAMVALGTSTRLIVGEKGLVARSLDAGESWDMLDSPYTGSFFGAVPVGADSVVVYGMRGRLYKIESVSNAPTIDPMEYDPFSAQNVEDPAELAARGWSLIETPSTDSMFAAKPLPGGTRSQAWVLVGNAGLILTANRDFSQLRRTPNRNGDALAGVVPLGNGRIIAVGRQGIEPFDLAAGE